MLLRGQKKPLSPFPLLSPDNNSPVRQQILFYFYFLAFIFASIPLIGLLVGVTPLSFTQSLISLHRLNIYHISQEDSPNRQAPSNPRILRVFVDPILHRPVYRLLPIRRAFLSIID